MRQSGTKWQVMGRCGAVLAALAALGGCTGKFAGAYLPEAHTTVTEDGWSLSVLRYAADAADAPAVVLCHGLSYNGRFWDLSESTSLARYLRAAGYDVWVPSLRGAGWSTKPPHSRLRQLFLRGDLLTAGGAFTSAGRGITKLNWTVDDHVRYDVPAILELVTARSKRPAVYWVGHSMGGMILVGHLHAVPAEPRLAGFVALATPVFIEQPLTAPMEALAKASPAVQVSNAVLSTSLPAVLAALSGGKLATPIDVLFYNARNMAGDTVRRLSAWATEDISPGQLAQLIDMVRGGSFRSADRTVDYTAALERRTTPALFVAGTVDNLATVGAVQRLHNRWGGPRDYALLGVVNGQRADYGHDDLVLGPHARQEVWPVVLAWLDRQCGKRRLPGTALEVPKVLPR